MKFLNWELKLRKIKTQKNLPGKYLEAEKNKKLYTLPNEFFSPQDYLQNLIDQISGDIYPLLETDGGAPFTVVRNCFCYIDHLSQLVYGPKMPQSLRMKKVISELGKVDANINGNYAKYSEYLIQIFRHDLIHSVRPFPKSIIAESSNSARNVEAWFFMVTNHEIGQTFQDSLKNMMKRQYRKNRNHLRLAGYQVFLDTKSLLFDLVIYLEELIKRCEDDAFSAKLSKNYYKVMKQHYYSIENFRLNLDSNKGVIILEGNSKINDSNLGQTER